MVKIKSQADIQANYEGSTGQVPARYKRGVEAVSDWKGAAVEGQSRYEQRMSDPNVLRSRVVGLNRVSNEEWKNKASVLGSQRIAGGMRENSAKQARNFEPYRQVIAGLTLPARGIGTAANIARVEAVALALENKKKAMAGGV